MKDYLIVFETVEQREAVFPRPEGNPPAWDTETGTVLPVAIRISDAVMSPDGETAITPPVFSEGVWVCLRTQERVEYVEAMVNCMVATDVELATEGLPYVHFCRLQPETILGQVEPMFSGDGYSIPVGQPASVLNDWLIVT